MKFNILFIKIVLILNFNYCIFINEINNNDNNENNNLLNENNFETKLNKEKSSTFRLLNILSHPDHFIFPEQNSFYNKTELIYSIGEFTESTIDVKSLQEELKNCWVKLGGEEIKIINLNEGINKMIENIKLEFNEQKCTNLLILYGLGSNILEEMLETKTNIKTEFDQIFAYGLNDNFKKVIKVISGLNISKDISLNELIENQELLNKISSIGSKVNIKYLKLNENINFELMISNEENAEQMSGQLLNKLIDNILNEVNGKEGTLENVKTKNDDVMNKELQNN
ncbi:hypothetical protein Mgra_00004264 [Meloidogyne graminicola]|uniref:Uncharacterized protein n=1 Tax=Meloidogyne graminicola TaxID=189291 RepID=A0A8S9ZSP7_9BILA|nr:hypothetical protein Mgra_00004264 [Meloidogyne graminicola]